MKDQITRIDFDKEQWGRISLKASNDKNISGDAFHLLFKCLNNTQEWKIRVGYFANQLGWKRGRERTAVNKLIEHGYLRREQVTIKETGKKDWVYVLNEYGTLNREQPVTGIDTPIVEEVANDVLREPTVPTAKVVDQTDASMPQEVHEDDYVCEPSVFDRIYAFEPTGKYQAPMNVLRPLVISQYNRVNKAQQTILSSLYLGNEFERLYMHLKMTKKIPAEKMMELNTLLSNVMNK